MSLTTTQQEIIKQHNILRVKLRRAPTGTEIAEALNKTPQGIGASIAGLMNKGYVQGEGARRRFLNVASTIEKLEQDDKQFIINQKNSTAAKKLFSGPQELEMRRRVELLESMNIVKGINSIVFTQFGKDVRERLLTIQQEQFNAINEEEQQNEQQEIPEAAPLRLTPRKANNPFVGTKNETQKELLQGFRKWNRLGNPEEFVVNEYVLMVPRETLEDHYEDLRDEGIFYQGVHLMTDQFNGYIRYLTSKEEAIRKIIESDEE